MSHLLANVCFLGLIAGFSALSGLNPDAYYQHVQEDQPLEWATFWAFAMAGVLFASSAASRGRKRPFPWFAMGLAAFCLLVALEEISWGQRVFGYSPPRYFLENNFQQELNLHNVMPTDLRKQLVAFLIAAYGIVLPLLQRIGASRRLLAKLGIEAPPFSLVLPFIALLALLWAYPIPYTGEIIEGGMALCFLFAAITTFRPLNEQTTKHGPATIFMAALTLVILLGFGGAWWSRGQLVADPVVAEVAATELRALEQDVRELLERERGACGRHERLHFIDQIFRSDTLRKGRFMALTERGLPKDRAEFFIDPWSTAYWLRTSCTEHRDKVFLYSFGPNRRRDSSRWHLGGDDVGIIFRIPRREPDAPMASRE